MLLYRIDDADNIHMEVKDGTIHVLVTVAIDIPILKDGEMYVLVNIGNLLYVGTSKNTEDDLLKVSNVYPLGNFVRIDRTDFCFMGAKQEFDTFHSEVQLTFNSNHDYVKLAHDHRYKILNCETKKGGNVTGDVVLLGAGLHRLIQQYKRSRKRVFEQHYAEITHSVF